MSPHMITIRAETGSKQKLEKNMGSVFFVIFSFPKFYFLILVFPWWNIELLLGHTS